MRQRQFKKRIITSQEVFESVQRRPDIGDFPPERALLTPKQVCAALQISPRTLLHWKKNRSRRTPRIAFVKLGRATRYVVADVLRIIEEGKVGV